MYDITWRALLDNPRYGQLECFYEGFPEMPPGRFIDMFCKSHKGCTPDSVVTRIEFSYLPDQPAAEPQCTE